MLQVQQEQTGREEPQGEAAAQESAASSTRTTFTNQGTIPPVVAAPTNSPPAMSASDRAFGPPAAPAAQTPTSTAPPTDAAAGARPSFWQRVKALDADGTNKLVDLSVAGKTPQPGAEQASTPAAPTTTGATPHALEPVRGVAQKIIGTDDRELATTSAAKNVIVGSKDASVEHSLGTASAKGQLLDAQTQASGDVHMSGEHVAVGGNAGATAKVIGTQVAISSRPFTHELFGEQVTAQFQVGVDAAVFAESKGQLGLDVGWSGFGAHAHLTGASNASVGLTGAATMVWAKKSPTDYARRILQNGAWRNTIGTFVPHWILRSLPDERVESWLGELVGLLISGGGGDAVVLGATTTAGARAALGLPELHFEGGALHCGGAAGLSFGGASANVDLQLGRTNGMELLSLLALGGAGSLFGKLMPNLSIASFLRDKLGAQPDASADAAADPSKAAEEQPKPGSLKDRFAKLDKNGTNSLVDWKHDPDAGSKEATTKGEGHDFTYTRAKGESGQLLTGDAARTQDADQKAKADAREAADAAQAATTGTKLKALADKALGGERTLAKKDLGSHSAKIVDEKSVAFGGEETYQGHVKGHALDLEAHGAGEVAVSSQKLRVGGNAGASAYLVAGEVHIETPEKSFELFGEKVLGKFEFGVDAGAFAEANGNINVDVGWKGAGLQADISGFAGAKAGATAAGALKWQRKSPSYYAQNILKTGAWRAMFGHVLPGWLLAAVPDKRIISWIEHLVSLLTQGDEGEALVLGAAARAEGSLGIGGAAAFSAGMRGGVLHCHGRGGLTFGAGAGANVDLSLGLTDGLAMLGVMTLNGASQLHHLLQPSMDIPQYLYQHIKTLLHHDAAPPAHQLPSEARPAPTVDAS